MTILEISLLSIIYILIGIISYTPLKIYSDKGESIYPMIQTINWPITWVIIIIIALEIGFKNMFKKN